MLAKVIRVLTESIRAPGVVRLKTIATASEIAYPDLISSGSSIQGNPMVFPSHLSQSSGSSVQLTRTGAIQSAPLPMEACQSKFRLDVHIEHGKPRPSWNATQEISSGRTSLAGQEGGWVWFGKSSFGYPLLKQIPYYAMKGGSRLV